MAEPRLIEQHPLLFPAREVWKPFRRDRTPESIEPIAIDTCEADVGCVEFLAAHALDRVAPEAFHIANHTHDANTPPWEPFALYSC